MIDAKRKARCRAELIRAAQACDFIAYGKLAEILGVANQSIGHYLNAIYSEEIASRRPDLTLVAVYQGTEMGRYNSGGAKPQSKVVKRENPSDVRAYKAELERVYTKWAQR